MWLLPAESRWARGLCKTQGPTELQGLPQNTLPRATAQFVYQKHRQSLASDSAPFETASILSDEEGTQEHPRASASTCAGCEWRRVQG